MLESDIFYEKKKDLGKVNWSRGRGGSLEWFGVKW